MIDLEKTERLILVLLVFSLLAGICVSVYNRTRPMVNVTVEKFDISPYANSGHKAEIRAENIDINGGSTEELMSIEGIGPVLAERIVAYRLSKGRFDSVDEIKNVKGIGPSLFEKIKDRIIAQ